MNVAITFIVLPTSAAFTTYVEPVAPDIAVLPLYHWKVGVTLGDDEYFVMGDNRNHSMDSRDPSVGNIKRDDFIGKAFIRIYPFETFGGLD